MEDFSSKEEKFEQWRYNNILKELFSMIGEMAIKIKGDIRS
ncbi:hypothetical protein [Anaerovibrio sp.]|nr:hypothetical protein [Anaerovibrio sp.]